MRPFVRPRPGRSHVRKWRSPSGTWKTGDLLAQHHEGERWTYTVIICAEERRNGRPAVMAEIEATSWDRALWEIVGLGFRRPQLTATQVQAGGT